MSELGFDIRSWPSYRESDVPPIPDAFRRELNAINPAWEFIWMPAAGFYGVLHRIKENRYGSCVILPICREDDDKNLVYREVTKADMARLRRAAFHMRHEKANEMDVELLQEERLKSKHNWNKYQSDLRTRVESLAHKMEKAGLGDMVLRQNMVSLYSPPPPRIKKVKKNGSNS